MTAIAFKWWNFRFSVIAVVCICMGYGGLGLAASIPTGFELADEDIYDAPSKAQVVQRWFVTETPTRQELQAALESMHKVAMDKKGFRYHPKTTNVYVYVFADKARATDEKHGDLWFGMSGFAKAMDSSPRITINDERLTALAKPPEVKHGLSEETRKKIWYELMEVTRRASEESRAMTSDWEKQLDAELELADKYKEQLAKRYNISKETLFKIGVEGLVTAFH